MSLNLTLILLIHKLFMPSCTTELRAEGNEHKRESSSRQFLSYNLPFAAFTVYASKEENFAILATTHLLVNEKKKITEYTLLVRKSAAQL